MDTILRDAHQSQAATRMKIEDMIPILPVLDSIGYWSLECWGGATFDVCMRFLNEDPWERLRTLKKGLPNTKLQMLLRGQNILGYKHYADDVVDAFCRKSIENGIDIIRIFDALNDVRNLEQAIKSTKKYGGIVEATLSYTISPIHNEDYFVKLAKELEQCFSGSGAQGLPGDWSSPSRFVRLAFLRKHAVKAKNEEEAVTRMLHLFESAAFPLGAVRVSEPGEPTALDADILPFDYTIYTAIYCAESLRVYWTTYENQRVQCADLHHLMHRTEPVQFDFARRPDFLLRTQAEL